MDTLTGVDRPAEPDGFRDFVESRSPALLRSGWLLTGDWSSAEDLVQTALAAREGLLAQPGKSRVRPALP